MEAVSNPSRNARIGASLPWLFFGVGCLALLYSVVVAITETGDPPYLKNDHWQRAAIIASPVLFNLAIIGAAIARQRIAALLIAVVSSGLCLLGWQILHWDIPKLFP